VEGPGCEDYNSRDFSQDKLGPCLSEGFKISVLLGDRRRNVAQSKHRELHSKTVVPNWWVATQKLVVDPFSMGRQTLTGKMKPCFNFEEFRMHAIHTPKQ